MGYWSFHYRIRNCITRYVRLPLFLAFQCLAACFSPDCLFRCALRLGTHLHTVIKYSHLILRPGYYSYYHLIYYSEEDWRYTVPQELANLPFQAYFRVPPYVGIVLTKH